MDKITFQNGTLVSPAKVNIDGTIYEVTPAEFDGSTPLTASLFNQMQTNIENAINALNTKLEGSVLYENAEGISEGNIVLNESMANYKRLVFYSPNGEWIGEMLTNATQGVLQQLDQGSENTMLRIARLNITNNTTLTFYSNKTSYYNGTSWGRSTVSYLTVGKVVGYNY